MEGSASVDTDYFPTFKNMVKHLNMEDFFTSPEKQAKLREEGKKNQIVFLVGFPCDIGARNKDGRGGLERGPESFRELFSLTAFASDPASNSLENSKKAANVKIYDLGNVEIDHGKATEDRDLIMEIACEKLKNVVNQVVSTIP